MRLLFVFAFAGCVTPGQGESPIGEVERDCVIPVPDGIRALGAPVSIELEDGSLWIWESLERTDGSTIVNPAARSLRVNDACTRPPLLERDENGPRSILALTAEEIAANAARVDRRELALVPTGGFSHEGRGYLYYDHVLRAPGSFAPEVLGSGLCVIDPKSTTPCERVRANDTTLLWRPDERIVNRGGFVDGNRAVIAGCRKVGTFEEKCTVTGVHVASVRDPWAYFVYNVFDGWVEKLVEASEVTDTIGSLTLAPFDDGYIAVELDIFTNEVGVRLSNRGEKGYGARRKAFDVLPTTEWFVSGGREHISLRNDSRSIMVSYATTNPEAPGLHLVDFRLFEETK
jgi:hypothetical protein